MLNPSQGPCSFKSDPSDRPVRREESLDPCGDNRISDPQAVEGGRIRDPRLGADGKFGDSDVAGVLLSDARIRLGEQAGEPVARRIVELDLGDILQQPSPTRALQLTQEQPEPHRLEGRSIPRGQGEAARSRRADGTVSA